MVLVRLAREKKHHTFLANPAQCYYASSSCKTEWLLLPFTSCPLLHPSFRIFDPRTPSFHYHHSPRIAEFNYPCFRRRLSDPVPLPQTG